MQKLFFLFSLGFCLFTIGACHSGNHQEMPVPVPPEPEEVPFFFPVTEFLKGQLREIDSMAVTPLKITTKNGKPDSIWLNREDIRGAAATFLVPLIDSASMSPYFSEKSFMDQTVHALTLSYDPKGILPDSLGLAHYDVYIDPQTNKVDRIYLVKEVSRDGIKLTRQLTWVTGKWFMIRTLHPGSGGNTRVEEEKMIWNFDE